MQNTGKLNIHDSHSNIQRMLMVVTAWSIFVEVKWMICYWNLISFSPDFWNTPHDRRDNFRMKISSLSYGLEQLWLRGKGCFKDRSIQTPLMPMVMPKFRLFVQLKYFHCSWQRCSLCNFQNHMNDLHSYVSPLHLRSGVIICWVFFSESKRILLSKWHKA